MIRPDVDQLIAFMDSLVKIDPVAIGKLIAYRVPCNTALGEHKTVQTGLIDNGENYEVGLLGILNGYMGVIDGGERQGWGMVAALVDKDGRCIGFARTDSGPLPKKGD